MKFIMMKSLLFALCLSSLVNVCYSDATLTDEDKARIKPYLLSLTKETLNFEKDVDLKLENLLNKISNLKTLEAFYWTNVSENLIEEIEKVIKFKHNYIETLEQEKKKAQADDNLPLVARYEAEIAVVKDVLDELNKTKVLFLNQKEIYEKLNTQQKDK